MRDAELSEAVCSAPRSCSGRAGSVQGFRLQSLSTSDFPTEEGVGGLVSGPVVSDSFASQAYIAHQATLSMGFPRQKYWNGLPFPFPGDLPSAGMEPMFPALAGRREWPREATREAPGGGECVLSRVSYATWEEGRRPLQKDTHKTLPGETQTLAWSWTSFRIWWGRRRRRVGTPPLLVQIQRGDPKFSSLFNQLFFVFRTKVEMTQWGRKVSTACPGHTIKTYMLAKGASLLRPSLQTEKGSFWPGSLLKHSTGGILCPCWRDTVRKSCSLECSYTKGFVQIPSHDSINAKKN